MEGEVYPAYSVEINNLRHYVLSLEDSWKGEDPEKMANLIIELIFPKVEEVVFYAAKRTKNFSGSVAGKLILYICKGDMPLSSIEPYRYSDETLMLLVRYGYFVYGPFGYQAYKNKPVEFFRKFQFFDMLCLFFWFIPIYILLTPVSNSIDNSKPISPDWSSDGKFTWKEFLFALGVSMVVRFFRDWVYGTGIVRRKNRDFHNIVGRTLDKLNQGKEKFESKPIQLTPKEKKSIMPRDIQRMFLCDRTDTILDYIKNQEVSSLFILDPVHSVNITQSISGLQKRLASEDIRVNGELLIEREEDTRSNNSNEFEEDVPLINTNSTF